MRIRLLVATLGLSLVGLAGPASADDSPVQAECDLRCQEETFYPIGKDGMKAPGRVVVRGCFNASGPATEVTVRSSSGHPELDASAVRLVKRKAMVHDPLDDTFKKGCRKVTVTFLAPAKQHPVETDQQILGAGPVSLEWPGDSRGEAPLAMPQCDEHCQRAIRYPVGKDGQQASARVYVDTCFNPEGEPDVVTVKGYSRVPSELAEAARAIVLTLKITPFEGSDMPPHRCHVVRVAFRPEAGPGEQGPATPFRP